MSNLFKYLTYFISYKSNDAFCTENSSTVYKLFKTHMVQDPIFPVFTCVA